MRPRRPESQQAILDAAMELLTQVGYDRMTMDLVAEHAKAGKSTIYRHWTGKADLVRWAIGRHAGRAIEPPRVTGTLRGDLLEALRAVRGSVLNAHRLIGGFSTASELYEEVAGAEREQVTEVCLTGIRSTLARPARLELRSGPERQLRLAALVCALIWDRAFTPDAALDDTFLAETVDEVLVPLILAWSRAPIPCAD